MRIREAFLAFMCALAGAALAVGARLLVESWPSPVIYYSPLVIGTGAALVVVRYGRLGPFRGELGSPKHEGELLRRIAVETERAGRDGRELTILAVRGRPGATIGWDQYHRTVDQIVPCRKGLTIVILPETTRAGALSMLSCVDNQSPSTLQAALVSFPGDGGSPEELAAALLDRVRGSSGWGNGMMTTQDGIDVRPISA